MRVSSIMSFSPHLTFYPTRRQPELFRRGFVVQLLHNFWLANEFGLALS